MRDFDGARVWITGASAGIGRGLALEFARRGADVAVSARRTDRLRQVVGEIEALGRRAISIPCDVTVEQQVRDAAAAAVEGLSGLDVAVANAGFAIRGSIEDLGAADWRRQLDVNVVGVAMTAKYALSALRASAGRLAIVGSVAAMVTGRNNGAYAASKAAVRAIGQTLAIECHGSGVTCTTIHPGFVDSDIARVDRDNVFHPDRPDKRPQKLMWATERAARVMVDAIHKRKRDYVFTGHGKIGGFLGRHWPALLYFAQTRPGLARALRPPA